jgi:hypothetical protein
MSNSPVLPLFGWLCLAHGAALILMVAAAVAVGIL